MAGSETTSCAEGSGRAVAEKLGRFQREISSEIENFVPGRDMQPVHLNDPGKTFLKSFLIESARFSRNRSIGAALLPPLETLQTDP